MLPRRNLSWVSLASLAGLLPVGVLAQSTTASCSSDFNWMSNSKDQSPCLLASYLQAVCDITQAPMPALPPLTHYTGPYASQQNPCECSSVTYNAVSACGFCQNRTIVSWTTWNANCSTVYPGVFPPGVPNGTAIPQWAFQDVTTSNNFNLTLALSVGDNPESTASHASSTGSSLPTTSTTATSVTASASATSGSTSNAGPIAGGVIGGVAGVALITGVVVFFVMRKKRSRIPPSAQFTGEDIAPHTSAGYTDTNPFPSQMTQPRLYDPSDPSTFPVSPPPTTIRTGSSYDISGSAYYTTPPLQPSGAGHYSGAAEI